jgi:hypothetical protein
MDGKDLGNNFSVGFQLIPSYIANHGGYLSSIAYFFHYLPTKPPAMVVVWVVGR